MSYRTIYTAEELSRYISSSNLVAFDFETAPDEQHRDDSKAARDAHTAHIVGISFSVAEGDSVYLPLAHRIGRNAENLQELWNWLAEHFYNNNNIIKVAHNLAFESMFLYARGIVLQPPCYYKSGLYDALRLLGNRGE